MSADFANEPFLGGRQLYVRAPRPVDFPSEEGPEEQVSETKRHLEARTTLYLLLKEAFAGTAIGSEQFVYWNASDPKECLSPDVFVKRSAPEESFDNWKVWERGAPDVAVEIVSASDRRDSDWAEKLERYQASGIQELVRFDAASVEQPIRVWDRVDGELVERAADSPDVRACGALGLWWAVAASSYGPMLRLARDREGTALLPTPNEERTRMAAELAEERKARTLAEHGRLLAEHAQAQAEQRERIEAEARAQAEQARAQAERRERVEAEARAAAEAELQRLRVELSRLRGGG